jgi:hypothetical protein
VLRNIAKRARELGYEAVLQPIGQQVAQELDATTWQTALSNVIDERVNG